MSVSDVPPFTTEPATWAELAASIAVSAELTICFGAFDATPLSEPLELLPQAATTQASNTEQITETGRRARIVAQGNESRHGRFRYDRRETSPDLARK